MASLDSGFMVVCAGVSASSDLTSSSVSYFRFLEGGFCFGGLDLESSSGVRDSSVGGVTWPCIPREDPYLVSAGGSR